jgi:DNA-binding CsgD family transcriptional regulator
VNLPDTFSSVLDARDRDEFRAEVVRFALSMGFQTVSALAAFQREPGRSESVHIDNAPAAYAEALVDPQLVRRDPVWAHCKRKTVPLVWDQSTYLRKGEVGLWEHQAAFGYKTGIAMAIHLPEGRHFFFGVDRDQALPDDPGELQRLVADLQLFAVHAQDAAMRMLVPVEAQPERPALTPRELEALRWTMDGKTAWEVGAVLGISERTAVLHLNNAMHKLNCVNKHQAVLKALRLGLIW